MNKVSFEVVTLTKGYSLEMKVNGLTETYGFKTREDLGGFLMDYFTKPKRPHVIRRKKADIDDAAKFS